MGKSYKRFPKVIQEREDYRYLNRQLRHDKLAEIPKGGSYRRYKVHPHDWTYRWSREQAIQQYYDDSWIDRKRFPTLTKWLQYWESCTLRK